MDRDGVINKMVFINGQFNSPKKASQVKLVKGVVRVITWLNRKKVPVIEITNQPDVALGKYEWKTLEEIEKRVHSLLNKKGAKINKIYRCFHHPKSNISELKVNCDCRKPKSGMLIQAARELNLDLKTSVVLGDNATDMQAGKKVGCKTILFFHTDNLENKIRINKEYKAGFKVYSHKEALSILGKLFQ